MSMQTVIILIVAVIVLTTVGAVGGMRRTQGRARQRLADIALTLGLRVVEGDESLEQISMGGMAEARPGLPTVADAPPALRRMLARMVPPSLVGTYHGVRVTVHTETSTSKSGSSTRTVFRAFYARPLPFELRVGKEGLGARIAKAFGGQDVEIGDPAFDAQVRLKASDPQAALALFQSPALRQAVLAALAVCPGLYAGKASVGFERSGSIRDAAGVRAVLEAIVPLAAALGDSR